VCRYDIDVLNMLGFALFNFAPFVTLQSVWVICSKVLDGYRIGNFNNDSRLRLEERGHL
jgi:hypothetical protein